MKTRATKTPAAERGSRTTKDLSSHGQIGSAKRSRQTRKTTEQSGGAPPSAKSQNKDSGSKNGDVPVHFELIVPGASQVFIAGSFNGWKPESTPMMEAGDGTWVKDLVLPAGSYEYRFVVDSRWISDPACVETAPNPFGDSNSVLVVGMDV